MVTRKKTLGKKIFPDSPFWVPEDLLKQWEKESLLKRLEMTRGDIDLAIEQLRKMK